MYDDLLRRYRAQYRMYWRFGEWAHSYEVIGARGGMHLSVTTYKSAEGQLEHSAGLETHWRSPPPSMQDQAPSHDECWLLKAPCWHDGTSLYAMEHWLPLHLSLSPQEVLLQLCGEAKWRFAEGEAHD